MLSDSDEAAVNVKVAVFIVAPTGIVTLSNLANVPKDPVGEDDLNPMS